MSHRSLRSFPQATLPPLAHAARVFGAALLFSVGSWGCRGGCPESPRAPSQERWEAELGNKQLLPLGPKGPIAIKRDVRQVIVDADAAPLATAFHAVMQDPERRYGLIRIDRLRANLGQPFQLGEKFQGRYSLEGAISEQVPAFWRRIFGDLTDDDAVKEWLCKIENGHTSDYGMITRLDLTPPQGQPHVLRYEYLEGSPIAGSSTFIITDIVDPAELQRLGVARASQIEQVFEYQELTVSFAFFFTQGGLTLHNQVVYSQAEQAAEKAGARVLETNLPSPDAKGAPTNTGQ